MKAIEKINIAKEDADVFLSNEKTQDEVGETGAKLFVSLYGGKVCDDLTDVQYSKYMNIDAKPIKIKPKHSRQRKDLPIFNPCMCIINFMNGTI